MQVHAVDNRFQLLRLLLCVVMLSAGCDHKNPETHGSTLHVSDKAEILATIVDEGKPQPVAPSLGMGLHAPQSPDFQPIFSTLGGGVAYRVDTEDTSYVVHNGNAGKRYDAVGAIELSPDGRRIAYGALAGGQWRMVIDGREGAGFSTVKSPLFSPDGNHLAYQALSGEKWYLVVDATPNAGTDTRIIDCQFSADSRSIAYLDNADEYNRSGRLVVSDLTFTRRTVVSPAAFRLTVDRKGVRIAAITLRNNRQHIVETSFQRPDILKTGPEYDVVHTPVYGFDGSSMAYAAERDGRWLMVFNGLEELMPDGSSLAEPPVVHPTQKEVGAVITANAQSWYRHFFNGEKQENSYDEVGGLTYSRDGSRHAYAARKGTEWFIVVNGVEGRGFDRVISPKFSPDGRYLAYRARKDGRRFVVVASKSGKIIRQHPAYEQVFDVNFTSDGKSVAYGVKDGNKLVWKVEAL